MVSKYLSAGGPAALVRVPDALAALGALGRAHRRRWTRTARSQGRAAKLVAVTGSAGKTTTTRTIAEALGALDSGQVHSPVGNLNNAVGIPLVLLGLNPNHGLGVIEIGDQFQGEKSPMAPQSSSPMPACSRS